MGGGIDKYLTAVGGRNTDTSGDNGATLRIHNDWTYGQLYTELP